MRVRPAIQLPPRRTVHPDLYLNVDCAGGGGSSVSKEINPGFFSTVSRVFQAQRTC